MFQFLQTKQNKTKTFFIAYCVALLLTIKQSPGLNAPPIQILENIKNVREKYENQSKSEAIWQSNLHSSIGEWRSSLFFGFLFIFKIFHFFNKLCRWLKRSKNSLHGDVAVIQQLLNISFWIDSLEANDDVIFYGNLTTTNGTMSLTLENFAHNIDNGAPSPSESGELACMGIRIIISWIFYYYFPNSS